LTVRLSITPQSGILMSFTYTGWLGRVLAIQTRSALLAYWVNKPIQMNSTAYLTNKWQLINDCCIHLWDTDRRMIVADHWLTCNTIKTWHNHIMAQITKATVVLRHVTAYRHLSISKCNAHCLHTNHRLYTSHFPAIFSVQGNYHQPQANTDRGAKINIPDNCTYWNWKSHCGVSTFK